MGDIPIGFEQAADGLVPQVVEVEVLDAQVAADATEGRADGPAVVGENETRGSAKPLTLFFDDGDSVVARVCDQWNHLIIDGFLARVLALADFQVRVDGTEIIPQDPADFILTHGRGDGEFHDAAQRNDLARVGIGIGDDQCEFFFGGTAVAFGGFVNQAEPVQSDAAKAHLLNGNDHAVDGGGVLKDGADEADVNRDGNRPGAFFGAAFGEVDQEFAADVADLGRADRGAQSGECCLFTAADRPLEFDEIGQVQIDQVREALSTRRFGPAWR